MSLLTIIILLIVCLWLSVTVGTPLFVLLGCTVGFLWLVTAVFARFVRWALGMTSPRSRPAPPLGPTLTVRHRVCPEPRCGRSNPPGARFCGQCGRRLA